jgi:hypothetical protein
MSRQTARSVYVAGDIGATAAQRSLVWVDRTGREEPLKAPGRTYVYPRISPDGTRVALTIRDQQQDIWIWELSRETLTRVTFDPGVEQYAESMPDAGGCCSVVALRGLVRCSGRRLTEAAPQNDSATPGPTCNLTQSHPMGAALYFAREPPVRPESAAVRETAPDRGAPPIAVSRVERGDLL